MWWVEQYPTREETRAAALDNFVYWQAVAGLFLAVFFLAVGAIALPAYAITGG
jgi:hypothetical protein